KLALPNVFVNDVTQGSHKRLIVIPSDKHREFKEAQGECQPRNVFDHFINTQQVFFCLRSHWALSLQLST
ncbi:MAG TPA: hypothetical protein VFM35_11240, partial [Candidatus Binatia bacterium]|nr:hypothetical protein [Candidatus Binatia bacterium]